ncbi:hypothetical protein L1887_50295 [Cichorium endivia]|nr:hypothetical protein L1887_50295 [Cichorium endivia]
MASRACRAAEMRLALHCTQGAIRNLPGSLSAMSPTLTLLTDPALSEQARCSVWHEARRHPFVLTREPRVGAPSHAESGPLNGRHFGLDPTATDGSPPSLASTAILKAPSHHSSAFRRAASHPRPLTFLCWCEKAEFAFAPASPFVHCSDHDLVQGRRIVKPGHDFSTRLLMSALPSWHPDSDASQLDTIVPRMKEGHPLLTAWRPCIIVSIHGILALLSRGLAQHLARCLSGLQRRRPGQRSRRSARCRFSEASVAPGLSVPSREGQVRFPRDELPSDPRADTGSGTHDLAALQLHLYASGPRPVPAQDARSAPRACWFSADESEWKSTAYDWTPKPRTPPRKSVRTPSGSPGVPARQSAELPKCGPAGTSDSERWLVPFSEPLRTEAGPPCMHLAHWGLPSSLKARTFGSIWTLEA